MELQPAFDINLFPRLNRIAETAGKIARFLFTTPEVHPYMSTHYHGASEMLDTQLYDQQRLEV